MGYRTKTFGFITGKSYTQREKEKDCLSEIKATECACPLCVALCSKPCLPTPDDVERLLAKGYAKRLMLDYVSISATEEVVIITASRKGYEGKAAPVLPRRDEVCTFLKHGLCELHSKKLKPLGGKLTGCKEQHNYTINQAIAELWSSEHGKDVVARWKKIAGFK